MDDSELEQLCQLFLNSSLHLTMLESIEKELGSTFVGAGATKEALVERLNSLEWRKRITNRLFNDLARVSRRQQAEAAYIAKAQANWEKRVCKSLNTMCSDLGVPLARRRVEKDFNALQAKWNEMSVLEKDVSSIRPVYASKDFLDVLVAIRCPNSRPEESQSRWGLIQAPLLCKTIEELRLEFHDLAIGVSQTGVDDEAQADGDAERERMTLKVLEFGSSPLAQEFAKRGVPLSYRGRLWSLALDVEVNQHETQYLLGLKQAVLDHDLLVDSLIYKDVKLTAANNDMYFVYEDFLHMVALMFSRDPLVAETFNRVASATPPRGQGPRGVDEAAWPVYPPSGVIPFHGFIMLACPLCFVYSDPHQLYLVFRELYSRHFYKLHVISSEPDTILGLAALFESLLQSQEPELFHYLRCESIQPLRIAFRWMMLAFSGLLLPEQVLLLWDRILAYESLAVLPIFAVGVFSFRKQNLMQVKSFAAAEAVLSDLTTLSVVPILQLTLFAQQNE